VDNLCIYLAGTSQVIALYRGSNPREHKRLSSYLLFKLLEVLSLVELPIKLDAKEPS
jgi:hypothetical protein